MAQTGQYHRFSTVAASDFRAGLAQNAAEAAAFDLGSLGIGGRVAALVRSVSIRSVQNLAWELNWYDAALQHTADADTNSFLGRTSFATADGLQIAASGLYLYARHDLAIPLIDTATASRMYLTLVNRTATAKNAGDSGELRISIWLEPQLGW